MMKLEKMVEVLETTEIEWVEKILEPWGYDEGTVRFIRASANFVFKFKRDGRAHFLRFNDSSEREFEVIESEIGILTHIGNNSIRIAQPIKSKNGRYIEVVTEEWGTFNAVVFTGLKGCQYELEELNDNQICAWGKALGGLHRALKMVPKDFAKNRRSWKDHLEFVKCHLSKDETAAWQELAMIEKWANGLSQTAENYGLIHYDFELDNLLWDKDEFSILDFDDCSYHWFVADIAYAIRDLFEEGIELDNPRFKTFISGYLEKTKVDRDLLNQLPWFMRMHNLVSFAKLLRSVNIRDSSTHPKWVLELKTKLVNKIDHYRTVFEKQD